MVTQPLRILQTFYRQYFWLCSLMTGLRIEPINPYMPYMLKATQVFFSDMHCACKYLTLY